MNTPLYPDIFVVHLLSLLPRQRGLRVLDAGCGAGRNALYLAQEGCRVTGIDRSGQMLQRARDAARVEGVTLGIARGMLEALPLAGGSFDVVVCANVLEQMTEGAARAASAEFWRVLRPGGNLLVVTVAQEGSEPGYGVEDPAAPFKARLASEEDLRSWFPGFRLVELLHLRLAFPASSPVRAQWAMVARRDG